MDCSTAEDKEACIDEINILLTDGKCSEAIALVDDIYNSKNTDNEVRTLRASAYGCSAQVNFFGNIGNLTTNSDALSGIGFWTTLTSMFSPATGTTDFTMDTRVAAAKEASLSLMAVLQPGMVLTDSYAINTDTYNPSSLLSSQRTGDSNLSLVLMSMGVLGNVQNRYGDPDTNHRQVTDLPWTTGALASVNDTEGIAGCTYAAAYLNLLDGIDEIASSVGNESVKTAINNVSSVLKNGLAGVIPGIGDACSRGCTGHDVLTGLVVEDATCNTTNASGDCNPCDAGDTNCITCPVELRDPSSCINYSTARCSAAGLVKFANLGWEDSS